MSKTENKQSSRQPFILVILLILLIGVGFLYYKGIFQFDSTVKNNADSTTTVNVQKKEPEKPKGEKKAEKIKEKSVFLEDGTLRAEITMPALKYEDLKKDESLQTIMDSRKKELGLKDSLDMVVHSDETITVDGVSVSVSDILEKSFARKGEIFEKNIKEGKNNSETIPESGIKAYGIYVVRPNDNIWDIHFNMLREYYESKGIIVSSKADQPTKQGKSSGVGKILKFSEKMVIVYNLSEKKLDNNINLIKPKSKVIVYNMHEIFAFLNSIDFESIDRLQFDGESLWVPVE